MKESNAFNNVLALIMVIGFFTVVFIMLFHEIPQGSKDMLGPIIGGVIGASVMQIINYKWGSSAGSTAKDESRTDLLNKMTGTGNGAGTTTTLAKTVTEEKKTTIVDTTIPAVPAWLTATLYKLGDVVTVGTSKYRALADHTSAVTDEPGVGNDWSSIWERQA